jgi:lipopolysaccharide cholinephosphotransferase
MADPREYYTDKRVIKELYRITLVTHNILLKNRISYYASGGTLIGSLRHKGIINWDDDVDIEVGYKDIRQIMSKTIREQFEKKGYKLKYHHEHGSTSKYDWVKVRSVKKFDGKRLDLDIFPMVIRREEKTGRLRTYFWSEIVNSIWPRYYLYIDELTPLRQEKFGDGIVCVPSRAEKALQRAYGKDWKKVGYITQDKNHFDLDEPIKLSSTRFKPAENFYPCDKQILLEDDDPLLTLTGSTFV